MQKQKYLLFIKKTISKRQVLTNQGSDLCLVGEASSQVLISKTVG